MNAVRERLLTAFAKSSGYELSQGVINITTKGQVAPCKSEKTSPFEESPSSVMKEAAISLEGYGME